MRPSLALSVARILLRVPKPPAPAPTAPPEPKHRQPRRQRSKLNLSRKALDPDEAERQAIIQRMTGWQRNRWARAGYPKSLAKIADFANMERDSGGRPPGGHAPLTRHTKRPSGAAAGAPLPKRRGP